MGLSLAAMLLVWAVTMVLPQFTQNSLVTISVISGLLIITMFITEMPDSHRLLYELWYLIPSNLLSLDGAFRYTPFSLGGVSLTTWQFAPAAMGLITAAVGIIGRLAYGKYQVSAR